MLRHLVFFVKFDQSLEYIYNLFTRYTKKLKRKYDFQKKTYLKGSASSNDRQLLYTLRFFGRNIAWYTPDERMQSAKLPRIPPNM